MQPAQRPRRARQFAQLFGFVDGAVLPLCLLTAWACSGADGMVPDGGGGSGGSVAVSTGGRGATGGATVGATGGTPGSGGVTGAGGATGHGGTGMNATGGTHATGGSGGTANGGSGGQAGGSGATRTGGAGGTHAGGSGPATGGTSTGGSAPGTGGASGGASSCTTPPAPSTLMGWASVSGMGQSEPTSGGGNAAPQTVTTFAALKTAVAGTDAAVVYVKGVMAAGSLSIGSNKTVVGLCGAELHGHVSMSGSTNVIFRNLKVVGYGVGDCTKDPKFDASVGCSSGDDAITVQSSAHHIWIDHCDISDGTDGNLDIVKGSDFVTVSWTKFHYTPRTDNVGNDSTGASGHRFSNLVGSSDDAPGDVGHLNITWHHDWWADNVKERMPRTRNGKIHVLNSLFTAAGDDYCTNAGFQASLLVEGNFYDGVANPLKPDANGDMKETNNLFNNTSGTKTATGKGFTPPYTYAADAPASLSASVKAGAGPH